MPESEQECPFLGVEAIVSRDPQYRSWRALPSRQLSAGVTLRGWVALPAVFFDRLTARSRVKCLSFATRFGKVCVRSLPATPLHEASRCYNARSTRE